MKNYSITEEQLQQIEHYKNMYQLNADLINDLCSSEKDDIVYGFELGKIHAHLRECFIKMMELKDEIRRQQF